MSELDTNKIFLKDQNLEKWRSSPKAKTADLTTTSKSISEILDALKS